MMKIFKRLFVTFLVVFTLINYVSCDVIKNFLPTIGSDLQLLRIETPSDFDNISLRKLQSAKKESKKETKKETKKQSQDNSKKKNNKKQQYNIPSGSEGDDQLLETP